MFTIQQVENKNPCMIDGLLLLQMLVRFLENNVTTTEKALLLPILEEEKQKIYKQKKRFVSLPLAARLLAEHLLENIDQAEKSPYYVILPQECLPTLQKLKENFSSQTSFTSIGATRTEYRLSPEKPIKISPVVSGNTIEITVDEYSGQHPNHWCRWQKNNDEPQTINTQREVFIANVTTKDIFTCYGEGTLVVFEFSPEMAKKIIALKTVQYQTQKPKHF